MRVVIAEDLALLRDGLIRLLRDRGFEVAAAVDHPDRFLEAVEEHRPDVCVVDVRLPPTFNDEGVRAALESRRRIPGLPILILSQYVEQTFAAELFADGRGGVGYLLKDRVADVADFVASVKRVAEGGTAFDPEAVAQLLVPAGPDDPLASLTPRELDVMQLMAEGRTNHAIANSLHISESAVEKHVSTIFGKLDLPRSEDDHRRVMAVAAYLRGCRTRCGCSSCCGAGRSRRSSARPCSAAPRPSAACAPSRSTPSGASGPGLTEVAPGTVTVLALAPSG